MRIEFDFQSGQATIPAAAAKCVARASDIALRLLILLAAEPDYRRDFEAHSKEIATQLKCSRKELDIALGFWCGAGIADIGRPTCPTGCRIQLITQRLSLRQARKKLRRKPQS